MSKEVRLKLILDKSQALREGQALYADLQKLFTQRIDIGINTGGLAQAKQQIQEVQKVASVKAKMDIDTDLFGNKVDQTVAKVKKAKKEIEEDNRIKISTSADFTELARLEERLAKAGRNAQNTKFNLGVKVEYSQLEEARKQMEKFQTKFGQLNVLRFNIKQESNIFNQINQSIKQLQTGINGVTFKKIDGEIKNVQGLVSRLGSTKINIPAYIAGSFGGDIARVKSLLNGIPRGLTIGIGIAGVQAVLGGISAIASALSSVSGSVLNFAGQTQQQLVGLGAISKSYIQTQSDLISSASQEKLTVEQLAEARGISTQALKQEVVAKGGGGGATGASKAYQSEILEEKRAILELKNQSNDYRSEIKKLTNQKKDLEESNKSVVRGYQNQIEAIQDVIQGLEREQSQRLKSTKPIESEIKQIEKLISTKQRQVDVEEKLLNQQREKALKDFDKATKGQIKTLEAQEKSIGKQIDELQKKKSALERPEQDNSALEAIASQEKAIEKQIRAINLQQSKIKDNKLANQADLAVLDQKEYSLKDQLEVLRNQGDELKDSINQESKIQLDLIKAQERELKTLETTAKSELDTVREKKEAIKDNRDALIDSIEAQQEAQRENIELRKDEIQADKEVLDNKKGIYESIKEQNEVVKAQFQEQIESQKGLIDDLKNKIEQSNIKLDINTEPFNQKLEEVQSKLDQIQEKSQDYQEKLAELQQSQAEASSAGGSSGGGGGRTFGVSALGAKLQAEVDKANKGDFSSLVKDPELKKALIDIEKNTRLSKEDREDAKNKVVKEFGNKRTTEFFDTTRRIDETSSLKQEDLLKGALDLSIIGYAQTKEEFELLARAGADFVASKPGKTFDDFVRSLRELSEGQFLSIKQQFGITPEYFQRQAEKAGLLAGKKQYGLDASFSQDDFIKQFTPEEIQKVILQTTKSRGIEGLDLAQSQTLPVAFDNFQTQLKNIGLSFLGFGVQVDEFGNQFYGFNKDGIVMQMQRSLTGFSEYLRGPEGQRVKDSLFKVGNEIAKAIGEAVTPENIQGFGSTIVSTIDWIKSLFTEENKNRIGGVLKSIASFVGLKSAEPTAGGKGTLTGGSGPKEEPKYEERNPIQKLMDTLTGAGAGFGLSSLAGANPFSGLINTGLSGWFANNFGKESGFGSAIGGALGGVAGGIGAGALAGSVVPGIGTVGGAVVGGVGSIIGTTLGSGAGGVLGGLFNEEGRTKITNWIEENKTNLGKMALVIGGSAIGGPAGGLAVGSIASLFDDKTLTKANEIIGGIGSSVGTFFTKTIPEESGKATISLSAWAIDRTTDFTRWLGDSATAVGNFFTVTIPTNLGQGALSATTWVNDRVAEFAKMISDWGSNTINYFTVELPTNLLLASNSIKSWVGDRINDFLGMVTDWSSNTLNFFTVTIPTNLGQAGESVKTWISDRITNFTNWTSESSTLVSKFLTQDIPNFLGQVPSKFNDTFEQAKEFVRLKVDGIVNYFVDLPTQISNALNGIGNTIRNAFGDAGSFLGGITSSISNVRNMSLPFQNKATGGLITGGSGVRDDVPLMAMGGEYVIKKSSAQLMGYDLLDSLNSNPTQFMNDVSSQLLNSTTNYYNRTNSNSVTNNYSPNFNIPSSGNSQIDVYSANDLARRTFKTMFA